MWIKENYNNKDYYQHTQTLVTVFKYSNKWDAKKLKLRGKKWKGFYLQPEIHENNELYERILLYGFN